MVNASPPASSITIRSLRSKNEISTKFCNGQQEQSSFHATFTFLIQKKTSRKKKDFSIWKKLHFCIFANMFEFIRMIMRSTHINADGTAFPGCSAENPE